MKKALPLIFVLTLCMALAVPARAFDMGKVGEYSIISCGYDYTVAIDANGGLWTCGSNEYGQLGDGTTANRSTPQKVLDNVAAVSCGQHHTAAIKTDGSLWTWGWNEFSQLGDGTTVNRSTPQKALDNVAAVSCGSFQTAAIKTDGSLWTWGYNRFAQLGDGTTTDRSTPVKVLDDAVAVSCGHGCTTAIKTDGSLWMWGQHEDVLSDGRMVILQRNTPEKVLDNVAAVSCGDGSTAVIKTDGSLWMWGENLSGELGDGTISDRGIPQKVLDNVAAVSCRAGHTAVIKTDGSLWTWGKNYDGELGDGTTTGRSTPAKVLDNVAAVSCGGIHMAAVKTDGTLWTWGENHHGQLGYEGGNEKNLIGEPGQTVPKQVPGFVSKLPGSAPALQPAPTPVATVSGFTDVAASAYYADAVKWAVDSGVTKGTSETTFSPDADLTRAQAVTFLWRAKGSPKAASASNPFADVKQGEYYYDAVLWAVEQGITNGVSATEFGVGGNVTRGQMVTFLWRTEGKPNDNGGAWYESAENWANAQNLLTGTAQAYSTNGVCPRADVVFYLWRDLAK